MSERRYRMRPVHIDLVGAIRRAYMRRGVFIPPATADEPATQPKPKSNEPTQKQAGAESKADSAVKQAEERNQSPDSDDEAKTPPELTGSQEPQEVHEQLIDVTEKAQDILMEANTIFPFTLFPDTITIDREKLTIAKRDFFRVGRITSAPLTSIINAEAAMGPFLGSVTISSKYFVHNTYSVNFLSRSNALKIQHMLQGFIIAQEKGIDLTDIDKSDLQILLTDLGQGVSD